MSEDPAEPGPAAADRVDARQLAFVGLAFVALVVAAVMAPTAAVPGAGNDSGTATPADGSDARDSGDGGGTSFRWIEWLRWLFPEGETPEEPRCAIVLSPPPEPGAEVTVTVSYDDAPLADAPVWLEDQYIGRTDDAGQVTAEVPYVQELSIRVGVEGAPDCRGTTGGVGAAAGANALPPAAVGGVGAASLPASIAGVAAAQSENASVSYQVNGEMALAVAGDPYPGETLPVRVTINGRPVPDAAVTLDGDRVATTDEDGAATITVPEDGREAVDVRAARGEFAASERLEVLLLDATLASPHLAVVPGADASVIAAFGNRSAEGAVVTVDGERRGRTDDAGRLDLVLPADPTATVRVEARGQTATTSVARHYAVPAALLGVLVAVAAGVAFWRRDGRAAATLVAGAAGLVGVLVAVAVVDAHYGSTARNALVAAVLGVVVAAGLFARRETVAKGGRAAVGLLSRLRALLGRVVAAVKGRSLRALLALARERLLAAALWIATWLGTAFDALRREACDLLARLRSLPRSVSGLLALAVARVRSALAGAVRALRSSPERVVVPLGAVVALAGGYAIEGWRGLAVAGVAVGAAWLLARRLVGDDEAADASTPADDAGEPDHARDGVPTTAGELRDRSLRELWRAFARLVVPGRWRTSTPEEVARAAVAQGYPRGPVEELTELFREVEYGDRSLSTAVRERAAAAFERLRRGGEEP